MSSTNIKKMRVFLNYFVYKKKATISFQCTYLEGKKVSYFCQELLIWKEKIVFFLYIYFLNICIGEKRISD